MKKNFLRAGEIICALCLLILVVYASMGDQQSNATFNDVHKAVGTVCDLEGLTKGDVLKIKKQFSFDTEAVTDFVYYSSDSVMDVRELVIIRLDDLTLQSELEEKIKAYVENKQQIFESYAPREEEMLASHVLIAKGGYVLFYVGNSPEAVASAFTKAIS